MEGKHRLSVASYNLHGLKQGITYLEHLCNDYNIIFVQEHWLAPFDLSCLDKIGKHMVCYASSAMDTAVSHSCLKGRPFGGLAVFVNSSYAVNIKLIKAVARYIILQHGDTVFINVYLPCKSSLQCEEAFAECLASILQDVNELQYCDIVFGGDLNVDFSVSDTFSDILLNFAHELDLKFVYDKLPADSRNTFRVESTGATSAIDHFAVTKALYDSINSVEVIDSGINLSDHCPVIMDLYINDFEKPSIKGSSNNSSQQLNFRWDKGDIFQYYHMTYDMLRAVNSPLFLMHDSDEVNLSKSDILHYVNGFYSNIVNTLYSASCFTIPCKRHNFYKYWWDEELSLLKEKAVASFRLWSALGKPRPIYYPGLAPRGYSWIVYRTSWYSRRPIYYPGIAPPGH